MTVCLALDAIKKAIELARKAESLTSDLLTLVSKNKITRLPFLFVHVGDNVCLH